MSSIKILKTEIIEIKAGVSKLVDNFAYSNRLI